MKKDTSCSQTYDVLTLLFLNNLGMTSSSTLKNTIMAAAIGILLSLGIVVLKEVLDDRVKKQEDIEEGLRNGSFRYSSTNKNNKKGG